MSFQRVIPILYSSNVVNSLKYYVEVLAFDCKWEWGQPPTFGGVSRDGIELFFCEEEQGNPGTWISIMVDDVDEYHELIKSKGATIVSPPDSKEWGIREMLVQDPDGHMLRIGHNVSAHRLASDQLPSQVRMAHRTPSKAEYMQLMVAVGWMNKDNSIVREEILKAPLFSVVAEDTVTGKAVGCALLLGDNASFYYVKDVMVDPAWQNKRIGTAMMKEISSWLEQNGAPNALVGLYTGGYLAPFYQQFGFRHAYGMSMRIPQQRP